MFFIQTQLGQKHCSKDELIKLARIPGLVQDISFNPNESETLLFIKELFPEIDVQTKIDSLNAPDVPKYEWVQKSVDNCRKIKSIYVKAGLPFRTDRYNTRSFIMKHFECPFCQNKEDKHCSPEGKCQYITFLGKLINTQETLFDVEAIRRMVNKRPTAAARKASSCAIPQLTQTERYQDNLWCFIVNGHKVHVSNAKGTEFEVASHMNRPWRSPISSTADQAHWKAVPAFKSFLDSRNITGSTESKFRSYFWNFIPGYRSKFNPMLWEKLDTMTPEDYADLLAFVAEPIVERKYGISDLFGHIHKNHIING